MKRAKKLYILLGVLVLACIATFVLTRMEDEKEQIKASGETILSLDSSAVTSLSWQYDDESLAFHKDETWLWDDDDSFPVSEDKINELLGVFEDLGAAFTIEDVEDYGQYGLDEPSCTIDIQAGEDSYQIELGDFSQMDSQRYLSLGDGNVYLVTSDPMELYEVTLEDMIENDTVPALDSVSLISIQGPDDYEISYDDESHDSPCEDDVYFTQLNGSVLPLDTYRVESYLDVLESLQLDEYATYNADNVFLESYGLDDPELSLAVDYSYEDEDGQEASGSFSLVMSRSPEDRAAAEAEEEQAAEAEAEEELEEDDEDEVQIPAYLRVGDSQIIYVISQDKYEALMEAARDNLRHTEVFTADFEQLTGIDVSLEGEDYALSCQKAEDEDEDDLWLYDEEQFNVNALQSAIEGLRSVSFTDEKAASDAKEEISLSLYLDNEYFPQIDIAFYRYDGSNCLCLVDGSPVSLVSRAVVVELIEAVNAIVLS